MHCMIHMSIVFSIKSTKNFGRSLSELAPKELGKRIFSYILMMKKQFW